MRETGTRCPQRRPSAAWRRCVLLLTFMIAASSAPALDLNDPRQALTQYKIDGWQTEQGLPLNTVQSLLQTSDGYLWVGTGGGLARFDGARFATFESADAPGLDSLPIFGLTEDAAGNVWIGCSSTAIVYRRGKFEVVLSNEVTEGRRVWDFAQATDGAVWIATENGLVRWTAADGVTKIYKEADGLPTDRLRALAFDTEGVLWIATTGGGLAAFRDGNFEVFTPDNGFPHLEVRSVLADRKSGVWAATAGGGLAHVAGGIIRTWTTVDGLPTDQLTALARDDQGSIWIGTWGAGLARLRDGRFESISTEGGLAGGQIWSVHADREGSIWVGTWVGGLNRLRNRAFVVLGVPEGLSHDNVRSVIHAKDGSTWLTTAGGGVSRIANGRIVHVTQKDGLPSDEASCILEARDGAIWVGTYTAGVARLREGRIETFGPEQGLPGNDIRVLFEDRGGTLWVGARNGLARFDGTRFEPVRDAGAPPEGILTMLEDRSGTLWMGTTGQGLFRYRDGAFDVLTREDGLVSNWIMALYEDPSGSIWIGTNGEGMNRLRDGTVDAIRPSDGLWDGISQVILDDGRGELWMTCNRGFYRTSLAGLNAFADGKAKRVTSVGYGPGDALRSTTFAGGHQPAGAVDGKGNLWLPTTGGLVMVDPSRLPGEGEPPAVRLEKVVVNGVDVPSTQAVELPPGSAPLLIRYTAMTLLHADRVRFRYRLEGTSGEWVDAGKSREAFFPALGHGEYRFHVAASLDGQHWRELAMPLAIVVRPRLYQTPWFLGLMLVGLLAATVLGMRWRTRQFRLRQAEMERLVAEQTEELRLANEHLARLSFVDALTGLANRRRFDEVLEQEWQRARQFRTTLSLVVADVDLFKPYNDTMGHLEGDRCLAAVAEVFRSAARPAVDLVARYGGEEFVILMPATEPAVAFAFAEAVRQACEARAIPHPASPVSPFVTISLGVASRVPAEEPSREALMLEADAALYRAKREGRNRVARINVVGLDADAAKRARVSPDS